MIYGSENRVCPPNCYFAGKKQTQWSRGCWDTAGTDLFGAWKQLSLRFHCNFKGHHFRHITSMIMWERGMGQHPRSPKNTDRCRKKTLDWPNSYITNMRVDLNHIWNPKHGLKLQHYQTMSGESVVPGPDKYHNPGGAGGNPDVKQ